MPTLQLPQAMTALRPHLGEIVATLEQRLPYGAVLLSAGQGLNIAVDDREERVTEQAPTAGTVVSVFDGTTLHETALGSFARDSVSRAARELLGGLGRQGDGQIDPGAARTHDYLTPMEIAPELLTTEEKLDRCRALHRRVRALDERIVNVRVVYVENSELSVFRNRAADLAQRVQRVRLRVMVFVAGPQGVRYDMTGKDGTCGWEHLTFTDDELQNVVNNAIALTAAERIEPGEYMIVTGPGVTGTICHEFIWPRRRDRYVSQGARPGRPLHREGRRLRSWSISGTIPACQAPTAPTSSTTRASSRPRPRSSRAGFSSAASPTCTPRWRWACRARPTGGARTLAARPTPA